MSLDQEIYETVVEHDDFSDKVLEIVNSEHGLSDFCNEDYVDNKVNELRNDITDIVDDRIGDQVEQQVKQALQAPFEERFNEMMTTMVPNMAQIPLMTHEMALLKQQNFELHARMASLDPLIKLANAILAMTKQEAV
jgi:hypothetical protein